LLASEYATYLKYKKFKIDVWDNNAINSVNLKWPKLLEQLLGSWWSRMHTKGFSCLVLSNDIESL